MTLKSKSTSLSYIHYRIQLRFSQKYFNNPFLPLYRLATSIYEYKNRYYHLLEQFVNDHTQGSVPTETLCHNCYAAVGKGPSGKRCIPKRPIYSIANGIDFGQLHKLDLPPLTLAEQIVLAPAQEMATVIKLRGIQNPQRQTALI